MIAPALALLALPQLPPRVYQPKLVDPGLHGGFPAFNTFSAGDTFLGSGNTPGDLTIDGRVMAVYRLAYDDASQEFRRALQVCVFDPDYLQESGGYLDAYLHQLQGPTVPGTTTKLWGTDYAISDVNGAYTLHFEPPVDPNQTVCVGVGTGPCPQIDASNLPNVGRIRPLALTLVPLPASHAAKGANPFPSDAAGAYLENGSHLTYEIWMVTPHYPVDPSGIDCANEADSAWWCDNGIWRGKGGSPASQPPILGSRELTVTIDLTTSPQSIESATIGGFTPFAIQGTGEPIRGIEPSITEDGRLLVYQGDGADNLDANGEITYVYNPTPCSNTGWQAPKAITAIHGETATPDFADRYALARQPIREPVDPAGGTSFTADRVYTAGDDFNGAYPWVSKDGSFFMATHVHSQEGSATTQAVRSGLMAVGAITGGYVKHVDDRALNPTRWGSHVFWPQVGEIGGMPVYPFDPAQYDTQMTTFFSTGLRPGPWEPFFDEGHPVPTMDAGARIPILPVWVHRTRMYGEVRFEEADGSYLLYLACNEAFHRNPNPDWASQLDPIRTPDSSGRPNRPSCVLTPGAAFVKEAWPPSSFPPGIVSIAHQIHLDSGQSHETIGFKGQGILFNTAGSIDVEFLPGYSDELTFQAFVKPMRAWDAQELDLITDDGRFQLRLDTQGRLVAEIEVETMVIGGGGAMVSYGTQTVTSNHAVTGVNHEFDPTEGWIHVAAVFDGDVDGASSFKLYLDGQVDAGRGWNGTSTVTGSSNDVYVGPRVPGGSTDMATSVLVLDEIAISDVARTEDELRRDAFVGPLPSDFEAVWYPQPDFPLPSGLDESEVQWPIGVAYSKAKADLGAELFADTILSAPTLGAPDGTTSCADCHEPAHGFAEALPKALDVDGNPLPFNTPTLLNSAFGTHKTFDGRAASLEEQVVLPLTSGLEMGVQRMDDVVQRLLNDPYYSAQFTAVYGGGMVTEERLVEVLAMHQRTLLSGVAPFDQGDVALSDLAEEGRSLFFGRARCFGCHSGSTFSDDDFHNIHSVSTAETDVDGLGGFTGRPAEIGKLKTPTLRDLPKTGPYFHDGSKSDLDAVVDHYDSGFLSAPSPKGAIDRFLVPIDLTPHEVDALVAFLESLSTP